MRDRYPYGSAPFVSAMRRIDNVMLGVFVLFVHFLAVCTRNRFQINELKIRQVAKARDARTALPQAASYAVTAYKDFPFFASLGFIHPFNSRCHEGHNRY